MFFCIFILFSLFYNTFELPNGIEVELAPPKSTYSDWYDIFYKSSPIIPLHKSKEKMYYIGRFFRANFLQAHLFCNIMNMHLFTILSKEENDQIKSILGKNNITGDFWTSGTRMLDGKTWMWMSTAKPVGYKNWGPGQPNNKNDHCIVTTKTNNVFIWNDRNCNCRFFFICEKQVEEAVLYITKKQESNVRKFYRSYFD